MKITQGTIEYIRQLAISRQTGELSSEDNTELFDAIDCLNLDEMSELYAIVRTGASHYGEEIPNINMGEKSAAEQLFGAQKLGTYLLAVPSF